MKTKNRITEAQLEDLVLRVNLATQSPIKQFDENRAACIDNYHIDYAYGGCALHRTMTSGGGIRDVCGGNFSKPELWARINRKFSYLPGIHKSVQHVVFRVHKGEVIAFLCNTAKDCNPGNVMSYAHIGQHGEIPISMGRQCRLAYPAEYNNLLCEMKLIYKDCFIVPTNRLKA